MQPTHAAIGAGREAGPVTFNRRRELHMRSSSRTQLGAIGRRQLAAASMRPAVCSEGPIGHTACCWSKPTLTVAQEQWSDQQMKLGTSHAAVAIEELGGS